MNFKEFSKSTIRKFPFLLPFVDAVQGMLHPLEQAALWKDYALFRRDTAFAREHRSLSSHTADGKGKTALIVLASDMAYEVKILAMLAYGLKMRGFRVVVFASKICLWARRYFSAYGINEFVYWEDWKASYEEEEEMAAFTREAFDKPLTFQAVKEWNYRSAWIGPQILSSVVRGLLAGKPDPRDPVIQENIRQILPSTLAMVHIAEKVLNAVHPDKLVLIEANYALMGALVDTAMTRNVTVIQAIQPSRDDALILKKLTRQNRRLHPFSVSSESMERLKHMEWTSMHEAKLQEELQSRYKGKWFLQSRNQPGVKEKKRDDIVRQFNLNPAKKTAVIFSPVLWDANLFYGDDLFEDFGDWFIQTLRAACANPRVNWLVKLHPANLWKRARQNVESELAEVSLIREHFGDPSALPGHVKLLFPDTDISTWSLFENADYGLTVRGTVGIEMPCFGKPMFTAGTGRYSDLGFTTDSSTKEEFLQRLEHIEEYPAMTQEQTLLAKKHAYALFCLRPWVMKSFRAKFSYKKKGIHPLDSNLFPVVKSLDELHAFGDLEKFASWVCSEEVDYLLSSREDRNSSG